MHLQTILILALTQWLSLTVAIPIPKFRSLAAGLQSRQFEVFANTDDSGALYTVGSPVKGTNSYRDSSGVYHDIPRRSEDKATHKLQARDSNALPEQTTVGMGGSLWTRTQAALLAIYKHQNSKSTIEEVQESVAIAQRAVEPGASPNEGVPAGILHKLDKGERIYF